MADDANNSACYVAVHSLHPSKLHKKATYDPISLFILFFLVDAVQKSLRLYRLKTDMYKISHECSSTKYASIYGVRFLVL